MFDVLFVIKKVYLRPGKDHSKVIHLELQKNFFFLPLYVITCIWNFISRFRALTPEQRNIENAILVFEVKDKDFLRTKFMAEAFLQFSDIPDTGHDVGIDSLDQIHLKLSRPVDKSKFSFYYDENKWIQRFEKLNRCVSWLLLLTLLPQFSTIWRLTIRNNSNF